MRETARAPDRTGTSHAEAGSELGRGSRIRSSDALNPTPRWRRSCWRMADGFYVVAIGIEDEGPEIIRVIVRSNAGRAIVAAASNQRRRMKGAHSLATITAKGNMHRRLRARRLMNPERRIALQIHAAEPSPAFAFHQKFDAQRSESDRIKRLAACVIGNLDTNVVEKQLCLARSRATVLSAIGRVYATGMITKPVSCVHPERHRLLLV